MSVRPDLRRLKHDGAASMRVEYLSSSMRTPCRLGWYVVRTCSCHRGVAITKPFDSRERAEHALLALDLDARRFA